MGFGEGCLGEGKGMDNGEERGDCVDGIVAVDVEDVGEVSGVRGKEERSAGGLGEVRT